MSQTTQLIALDMDCEAVILQIERRLSTLGLRSFRSFDLQSAILVHADLTCPHHINVPCDCQYAVLLVYGKENQPASLVMHSYAGRTKVYLVDFPDHKLDPKFMNTIRDVLVPNDPFFFPYDQN